MAPQWPVLVGLALVVACGEDKAKPAPSQLAGSGSQVVPRAATSAPDQPALASVDADPAPALPPPAKTPPADQVFDGEDRDPEWATSTERGIKQRFKRVRGGALRDAECRMTRCRLVIAGSESEVAQTIADLEGARGLSGFAASVLLTAPERKPDGSLELRAFALFER